MAIYSNLIGVEGRNKKHLTGLTFVCPDCKKEFTFEKLDVAIVPSGYDYLCPSCGYWVMVAEEIQDRIFPNIKSEVLRRERLGDAYKPMVFVWDE